MIESKEDLKRYLEMDRFAYHTDRKHPRFFGDDIWKFLIALRKQEYYTNVKSVFFSIIMKRFYSKRHSHLGNKLGYDIPVNTCGGGGKTFSQRKYCYTSRRQNRRMVFYPAGSNDWAGV